MRNDICGPNYRGVCPDMDPVDGEMLKNYLMHVNFTGNYIAYSHKYLFWNERLYRHGTETLYYICCKSLCGKFCIVYFKLIYFSSIEKQVLTTYLNHARVRFLQPTSTGVL